MSELPIEPVQASPVAGRSGTTHSTSRLPGSRVPSRRPSSVERLVENSKDVPSVTAKTSRRKCSNENRVRALARWQRLPGNLEGER
jgi:hypothetical protein